MADSKELKRIRRYVRQNKEGYLEAGLRERLIADGYNPQLVEQALAELANPSPPGPKTKVFWGTLVGVTLLNIIALWYDCILVPFLLIGEIIALIRLALIRSEAIDIEIDTEEQATSRAVGTGCAAALVPSLVVLVLWFQFASCSVPFVRPGQVATNIYPFSFNRHVVLSTAQPSSCVKCT